jgi:hypothetical protein
MKPIRFLAALAFAILAFGCTPAELLESIRETNTAIVLAVPFTEAAYRAELRACTESARTLEEGERCQDAATERWKAYVDVMDRVRTNRCKLEPSKCTSEPPAPSDTTTVTVTERP